MRRERERRLRGVVSLSLGNGRLAGRDGVVVKRWPTSMACLTVDRSLLDIRMRPRRFQPP